MSILASQFILSSNCFVGQRISGIKRLNSAMDQAFLRPRNGIRLHTSSDGQAKKPYRYQIRNSGDAKGD